MSASQKGTGGSSGAKTDQLVNSFNDLAIDGDKLEIHSYIDGFISFLQGCQTPLTTAIQGPWGSGKTSALMYVEKNLDKRAIVVKFNTWQYSQFDLGEQLVFSLFGEILSKLDSFVGDKDDSLSKKAREKIAELRVALTPLARVVVKAAGYGVVVDALDAVHEGFFNLKRRQASQEVRQHELIESLSTLRAKFQDTVHAVLQVIPEQGTSKSPAEGDSTAPEEGSSKAPAEGDSTAPVPRLFIFVDDLDRLQPERAVEMMEALKVFFDVEGCVFVLAIDFEVVRRGVKAKYGADFDEKKARAFFDKIIQVPFNLPTGKYNISALVDDGLEKAGVVDRAADRHIYEEFVRLAVGPYPRSIKRLFNTFILSEAIQRASQPSNGSKVSRENPVDPSVDRFALLALQTGFPEIFEDLQRSASSGSDTVESLREIGRLLRGEGEEGERYTEKLSNWHLEDNQVNNAIRFVDRLVEHFRGAEEGDEQGGPRWMRLQRALGESVVTAVATGSDTDAVDLVATSTIVPFEDRIGMLKDEVKSIAEAFENDLQESVGEFGVAVAKDGHWSYWLTDTDPKKGFGSYRGRVVCELHFAKKWCSVQYGNGLKDEFRRGFNEELLKQGVLARGGDKSNPPLALNRLDSVEKAREAAHVVAAAYERVPDNDDTIDPAKVVQGLDLVALTGGTAK